ncbi:pyridoxamine-phosphate oxidase [Coemansia sp. RSA 2671]|uniref:Pyridoxamine-phosphate oxidase n=1 Tax=Coemansia linderi TaxID=2663919 RepID=A0ACC1KDH6_9FUNG|nr:pyridoxamine-phosphate oxidase [Coemansia sp. RSA 2675]KAJ2332051.1 pyridoxamine-phosphate oxidase [Coemansia sp. RSA 2671]KAJ2788391.1 pyridoxamine-phosphate oxidase [Coemansia linderi]
MPEIQPDHFGKQYPNRDNPAEFSYVLAPSSFFALSAGVFAALSSVSAKLAVDQHTESVAQALGLIFPGFDGRLLGLVTRASMVAAIGASNFFMWLLFTKALRYGQSTARVMMLQTVANFATTAACGVYMFGDALAIRWWMGASLIAVGLALLNTEKSEFVCETTDTNVKKNL